MNGLSCSYTPRDTVVGVADATAVAAVKAKIEKSVAINIIERREVVCDGSQKADFNEIIAEETVLYM